MRKLIQWSDYLYMGLALAILFYIRGDSYDGFYLVPLVVTFFALAGVKDNVAMLKKMVIKYPLLPVVTILWTIYFSIRETNLESNRYALTAFTVIFAGFCISYSGKSELNLAMEKMWLLLFSVELIGVINYFVIHDFNSRMRMFFTHPIAEGDAAIVLAVISLYFIEDLKKRLAGILLSFTVIITGSLRASGLILIIILFITLLLSRDATFDLIKKRISGKYSKVIFAIVVVLLLIVGALAVSKETDLVMIEKLQGRYTQIIDSLGKDPFLAYDADHSFRYRIIAPIQAIRNFRSGSIVDSLLGHGLLDGYYTIRTSMLKFSRIYGENGGAAGPIENAFIALLSDYGLLAFSLYFGIYICSFITAIKCKELRNMSILLFSLLTTSAFIDMEYWISLTFFVWAFIGIYLGELSKSEHLKTLLSGILFGGVLAIVLYFSPLLYSWGRTAINTISLLWGNAITIAAILICLSLCVIELWMLSDEITIFVIEKKIEKKRKVSVLLVGIIIISIIVIMNQFIDKISDDIYKTIDQGSQIVNTIKSNTNGTVYSDTFPWLYNKRFGNIKGTMFSGASVANEDNATIIVSRDHEQYTLSKAGFLYLPISKKDAVYTNDDAVIDALSKLGYNLQGFNSEIRKLDLYEIAQNNGMDYESDSIILGRDNEKSIYWEISDIYGGKVSIIINLRFNGTESVVEHNMCSLEILNDKDEQIGEFVQLSRSQLDGDGRAEYTYAFDGQKGKIGFWLNVDSDECVYVESIEYMRTPDIDERIKMDQYGNTLRVDYYDLDGDRKSTQNGYATVEYTYDVWNNCIEDRYYDEDGQPLSCNRGFWKIKRTFDGSSRVVSEEYFGVDDKPLALAGGQASVEYEYDEEGNRISERYFGTNHEPILYNNQYWYVRRKFNDIKQNILEEYYGIDDVPVALSDGAYGYRRQYDDTGNAVVVEYLGVDKKPILNNWGYAILKRMFNDKKQIIREEYYDESDDLVTLSNGQAAVEYEYDELGNRTVNRYYDADNDPVLFMGQYWYRKSIFNEKGQNVLDKYYGLDNTPAVQPDGASAYQREYDDEGNVIVIKYFGTDGNLTLNTSGYAILRRDFNDNKQIIREEYYDENDRPVVLSGGQWAVEFEYDEVGNRIVDRYYSPHGIPLLYYGEYWYVVMTYNEKGQNIHEDYYGVDDRLILRSAGYCSVDIRYDDSGIITGKKFYNLDGEVVAEE